LRARRPLLHLLLLVALLARSAVAAGYMPDGNGKLLALCPDGLPQTVVEVLLGGAGHDHSGADGPDRNAHSDLAMERCALGAALVTAGLPTAEPVLAAPDLEALPSVAGYDCQPRTMRAAFRARAPPLVRQQN